MPPDVTVVMTHDSKHMMVRLFAVLIEGQYRNTRINATQNATESNPTQNYLDVVTQIHQ
jgi:tRNA U54 and U55 pseudouridine synthase Pus10